MFRGGQINVATLPQPIPIGDNIPVRPQARHAAVRENSQSKMRGGWRVRDSEMVVRVALQGGAR